MAPLSGVVPPLISPLQEPGKLDAAHLEKLIEYQLDGGVHGFFLLGTTGEGPSLSHALKQELVERSCHFVNRRVPVLVNISDTSITESVTLAQKAAQAGATALVVTAPYYFPLDQEDLWLYLKNLLKQLPLPVYLYNMPSHVKVSLGMELMQRAIQEPGILGIKDSSGDRSYLRLLLKLGEQRKDWSVMVGPEELFVDALTWGGHGGVLGGANLYPRLLVQLYHAVRSNDINRQNQLQEKMHWFHQHVLRLVPRTNGWLVGLKAALALQGLCEEHFAEPLHPMNNEQREQLRHALAELRQESEF
ncbi:MAG: dihydrodipicolinate synthase family protein [Planctomycetia bacterium]|nr:dihydrodipicolinate synthase family protein [Planctomycetia bacterium]